MPEYVYRCRKCGHEVNIVEPMHSRTETYCDQCGGIMRRRPLKIHVNWGGMRPSQGEIHPKIKEWIEGGERRREEEHA